MSVLEATIESIDWSSLEVLSRSRTGLDLKDNVRRFLAANTTEEFFEAWFRIEGIAFAQDTTSRSCEAVIWVMLAALSERRSAHSYGWIVEVIRFILMGGSDEDVRVTSEGKWLLAMRAQESEGVYQEAFLEVLEIIDPDFAVVVKSGLGSN